MTKIHSIVQKANLEPSTKPSEELVLNEYIGLEVELERASPMVEGVRSSHWAAKGDGSLREDGVEFVFKKPLAGVSAVHAIDVLHKVAAANPPKLSAYCSTHLHINFLDNTLQELKHFISTYMVLEDALARYCGPTRENNAFCLTFSNAEDAVETVRDMYSKGLGVIRDRGEDRLKYCALNLFTLYRFGTLEVRLGRPMIDRTELLQWINIMLSIKKYSLGMQSVHDILVDVSSRGTDGFIRKVLGGYADVILPFVRDEEVYEAIDRVQYTISQY